MKFAQTNLVTRTMVAGFAATIILGLSGCGKSEEQKAAEHAAAQRHEARQNFKQVVAALKVRTTGATYNEFRQAELDLKTSFEVNKSCLDDMTNQVANLDALMTATDWLWSDSIHYPMPLSPGNKIEMQAIQAIVPNPPIATKTNLTIEQIQDEFLGEKLRSKRISPN